MAHEATLSATFGVGPSGLSITSTLRNTSDAPIFLIDVTIVPSTAGPSVVTGRYRIELGKGCEIFLVSKLFPIDPKRNYAAPPRSYASKLGPGESKEIRTDLEFPLVPGNLPAAREIGEVSCDRVTLTYGMIPGPAVPNASEQVIAGTKVWRLPVDAWHHQQELRVDARVTNVRVMVNK